MSSSSSSSAGAAASRDRDDQQQQQQQNHGHVLRPRPRKPQHSQISALSHSTSSDVDGLHPPQQGLGPLSSSASWSAENSATTPSGMTSGRSTPVPENAPPSVKSLSSARKQARAEQRGRIFPTIEFASRVSHFDPASDYRDFHGFFNLFWIGLAIMGITTMLRNARDHGFPLRAQIWSLFTVKLGHLAAADALMVSSTAASLLIHRLSRSAPRGGLWTWHRGGMALQSVYEAAWFATWVVTPFYFEWTWTAQVFLLLHTMVLLMKMHSWAFYNGHLCETEKRLRALDSLSDSDHANPADRLPARLYPSAGASTATAATTTNGTTDANGGGRVAAARRSSSKHDSHEKRGSGSGGGNDDDDVDEIELLREDLARELTSPMGNVTYPRNLGAANCVDYLLCPTLCYELEYPRVARVNWTSLVSKIVATFGCIFLLTVVSEDFIVPVLDDAARRLHPPPPAPSPPPVTESLLILAETVSWLLFPFMLTFLLVFLVIFEYVLGAFAEITRFADRHFYADWWNSTDWMEFSREWNVPVYSFLRRHVYSASRPLIGKSRATVITFLISAVGHEIVMACITKKIRGYGFVCQMLQLPIFLMQRTRWVRGRQTLNNVFFWVSMIIGLSMICALYVLV